ncbi:hypothetical protein EVAR_70145_1 [Eumeta japonica]|uniref:Uncharacterized protein n=1 Tax=Eumeta variegata TaxID=151549 RepID=A0A4C2AA24_EUMVA|nr:hypothetical protein EVAR_70145_1 [Eumeta japonica]
MLRFLRDDVIEFCLEDIPSDGESICSEDLHREPQNDQQIDMLLGDIIGEISQDSFEEEDNELYMELQTSTRPDLESLSLKEFRRSIYQALLAPSFVNRRKHSLVDSPRSSGIPSPVPVVIKQHKPLCLTRSALRAVGINRSAVLPEDVPAAK